MDQLYDKPAEGRAGVLNALNMLNSVNQENPRLMITQFFFEGGKAGEVSKVFVQSDADQKARALDLLSHLDISNVNTYKADLQ
jgi:hypothetical protein